MSRVKKLIMEPLEINVRREVSSTNTTYLKEIGGILEVFIPVKDIGLHQAIKFSNSSTVHLKRCSTKASAVFQLSLEDRGSNQKPYLTVHCSLEDTICHVQLKHCQTKGRKLKVTADKISIAAKAMTCERLELECNLSMVVHSKMVCPYISLKSNHEVRLSASARLKTETLKLAAKTVFIDGHVKYERHFQNKMTNESNGNGNILCVHVCGNLHTGRDSVVQCCCYNHKSKNITGTLQLQVKGDICNHGTIEASELMEIQCKSLLSCRKCDKDTAYRYLSSITQKQCIDEDDNLLTSNIQLDDAVKRLDTKHIFVMLKHGFDPYSPIENKGATLTSTIKKLQWEIFCQQDKYDNDYTNLKLQVDNFVSLIESWNKQRGSIISSKISFKMNGDFEDISQVRCKQIFLEINGNICVENESICTLGCISGICKGDTRIHGQMKLGSFESFDTNDFSIYETGSLIIQNGGNISVDNCFHNGSFVYNLNNKLSIYTGVFQQKNDSQITSQEDLEINICKESRIVNGSFNARDLYLGISARVTDKAVIKSVNSCTLEFKENKNTKEYGSLNHKGCIEVENRHVIMSSTANVYDVKPELVIRGKGEFYNRTGGTLQCTHGPLRIQNVLHLQNESGASIFGKSIEIATAVVGRTTDTISKKHDLKNNGEINSPGVVKIFAGNLKNHGTIQSHYSQVEIHYKTRKNVITKLEGILLSTEGLTVFVHNATQFHCSFRGGSDLRKSSIILPKKGMWITCARGTVFFHNAIVGDAQLLVESKKGFVTLNHITVTLLCLQITNVYDLTNKENYTDPRIRQEISNGYEILYDRTNRENHTVPYRHPEIANGHEVLYDRSEMPNNTELRRDKHAFINILNGSLLRTEHMIVESNCDTSEIEVRTIGDGEMIFRYDFVCGPKLIINGHLTMSSSSLITAEKIITTEKSVCKIDGTTSETNEEMCKLKTSGNIELKGHIHYVHDDRSVPSLLVVESQCGNITVMGIVQVPNLSLLTGQCQKLTIESQMNLRGYVCIGGACKTTICELSNIECNKLIYQLTPEKSETRKINLDLNGSVKVHGLVNLDHIDDIILFGTLSCHGISAKHADVIMTASSITEIYYFEEGVEGGKITNSYQILTLNNLFTEKESQMKLLSENERTIPSLVISTWQHHGDLEVKDSGPINYKHAVRCKFSNFINHGKCVNIDSLYLHCDNTLSNFASLSVTDVLDINVVENIINNKGARLECTNGPLSIITKADIVNNGILISNDVNKIWAADISNAGIIESYKSTVELRWGSKENVSIDGIVNSLLEIQLSSPFSKEFHFCCSGGMANDSDRFVIPANGIKLKCTQGSVVLKMEIEGRQKSANVSVLCLDGCKIYKNLTTSIFHLERTFEDKKMLGNQKLTIDSLSETKPVSPNLYLWLKEDCTFVSRNLKAQTGSQNVTFFIRTDDSSKLICYEQILNLDSLLFFLGNFEISFYSQVRARSISLDKDSIVKVFAEEQIDPTFFLYEPVTTDNDECKLLSEMDIEINGNISSFKDAQIKASITSNSGDVIIKGEVEVPYLQIAAAVDRSVRLIGMVNTCGWLYLSRGRIIDIDDQAVLRCEAFSCEPNSKMNKSNRLTVNGQLHVMGPAHFVVESFYIARRGQVVIISENSNDHVVLEDMSTVDINGRFECRIHGDCMVDCKKSISLLEKSDCLFSLGECNLIASELIRMDDTCKIELKKGKLYIGNAREEDTTIHGSVELSGIICGPTTDTRSTYRSMVEIEGHCVSFRNLRIQDIQTADLFATQSLCVDSESKVSNVEKLEIQATSIDLKGLIENTPRIKILAASSFLIDKESKIDNDNQQKSKLSLQVTATTVEMKGQIQYLNNIDGEAKMHFDASNMLNTGKINSEGEIKIEADCSFVNNGQVRCSKIGIVAPICLNCPQNFDKSKLEHISQLGGENQKILVIEGLLCIIVGSFLHSKSINIKSVLNFQFSSKMSTIPQAGDLERWKSVVDSSLSKISMATTPEDIHKLTERTIKIQQVICDLSVSSHLCEDVVNICEKMSNGGLGQFDMNEMITSLDNAHSFYSKIIPLKLNVDFVRIKHRSLKKRGKKGAKNLINKIFGPKSFSKSLEFPQNNLDQGIRIDSFINEGKHTDIRSDGCLFFASLKFQGRTGLWKNDGYIEACGDIIISASKIKQLGGQGRIMKAITRSIRLTGDSAEVKNLESKHLHIDVSQEANLQSIKTEGQAVVQGNIATIQNIDSKTLHVNAQQEAQINTANIQQDLSVTSKRIATGNVNSKQLDLKAIENITVDNVSTKEIATFESGNTIDAKNIKVSVLNTTSKGNTDFGEIKADKMNAVSKSSNITLNGKLKAKEAKLEAKHGGISLTDKNKKVNHEFGSLTLYLRALEDINKLLNRSDVYKDLEIADHLGLIVEDQNVIIATQQKSQFSVSIKAASIDVRNGMDAKNIELETTKGFLKIDKKVNIKAKKNVRLTSKGKLQFCDWSSVNAAHSIGLESVTNSVDMSNCNLEAGSKIEIQANHSIDISSKANGGPCKGSKLTAGEGIYIESKQDIIMQACDIKGQGENTFKAGNQILLKANKYETTKRETKTSLWGICQSTTETTMTHAERSTISGRFNTLTAGGSIECEAASIKSKFGNDFRATREVSMLDIPTTSKTKEISSIFGIRYYQKDESAQQSQGTFLEDSSTEARTSIISETSNIEWHGSDLKSAGNVSEIAERGVITHSRRLLTHEKKETGFKVHTPKSTKDTEGHFGIEANYERGSNQTTSTDSTEIGGDYTLKAKKVDILNAANINVSGNMNVKTDDLRIEGASQEACDKRVNIGIGVESRMATVSANYEKGEQTTQQMQKLHVGGTLHFDNIKNVTIYTSNIESGGLTGQVDILDIKSRCDEKSRVKLAVAADIDLLTQSICGGGIDVGFEGDERITQPTSIDVDGGSKGLSVGTLETKGASFIFDGKVHKFAQKIVCQSVHEKAYELNLGLRLSKPNKMLKAKKKIVGKINFAKREYNASIESKSGKVDSSVAEQVETNLSKRRQVNQSLSFSFSAEFEGKISQQITKIGKDLVKAVGKEAIHEISHILATTLGIPQDVINSLVCFVEGGITNDKIYEFLKANIDRLKIPGHFSAVLQSLLVDGNPENFISWICDATNIDKNLVVTIIGIVRGKTIKRNDILTIVKHTGKHFGLSEELFQFITIIVSSCDNKRLQKNQGIIVEAFFKSKEGQGIIKEVLNAMQISEEINDFFATILIKPNNFEKAMFCLHAIGQRVGISKSIIEVFKDMLQGKTNTTLVNILCNAIGLNTNITATIELSLNDCCNVKSAVISFITSLSTHIGLSSDIAREIKHIIDGNMPECGMQTFVIQICIQISKSSVILEENHVTQFFKKLLPLAMESAGQISNAINLGSQILHGDIPTAGIPLLIYLLQHVGVEGDTINAIKNFAKEGNVDVLIAWLSKKSDVNQSVLNEIGTTLMNDCSIISIFNVIFITYSKKHDLHPAIRTDLELIMNAKPPEQKFKEIRYIFDRIENTDKRSTVFTELKQLVLMIKSLNCYGTYCKLMLPKI